MWVFTGGSSNPMASRGPFIEPPHLFDGGEIHGSNSDSSSRSPVQADGDGDSEPDDLLAEPVSSYQGQIRLGRGNAKSESSAKHEYIIIKNRSRDEAVNISGWKLTNSSARRSRANEVSIPGAVELFSSLGAISAPSAILLEPGHRAVITTGRPPGTDRWPAIVNFRTNKCIGYLAKELRAFRMNPALPRTCPRPREESGIERLRNDCYEFVRRYTACRTPEFRRDSEGYELLDGRRHQLTPACREYLLDHFSYDRCLAWHELDDDFYGNEWRVYLHRSWELWLDNRETISLYDDQGLLVDEISY